LHRVPLEGVSTTFEGEYQGRWWEVNAYPKNGGVSVYFRDITERKRAALELFESEQRYRLVAKATKDLIWDWDIRTDRVYFNEALTTVFQYPRSDQQYVFASWAGLVHPDDHEHIRRSFAEALAAPGDVWSREYRFRRYDGTYADVFDRACILRDADGRAIRAIGAMQDLSEQKRIERIERERDGLRNAVEAMEQVLGVVAHELRTPLAAMRAIAELLISGEAMQLVDRDVFLRNMQEATVRMSDTVDTLLEAARLNSGRARWNWQDVDLGQACQDAIETARPLLTDDRVELTVAVIPPSPIIRGDADALRRLITNLVSNAMKYTTEGAITVAARVVQEEGRNWAEITVADTGRGIPEEIVSRLGEAFALNSGVVGVNHVEGTGLGLSICRGIASAHGGVIRIDSAPGQGTTIHVRLRADLERPVDTKGKIQFFPQMAVKGKAA
jgi:sigma-B regulation protein RsbU (phosphoserine phosphatase)